LKSEYGWEQFTFWFHLWLRLRREAYDILHVQDPMLAFWCRKFRKLGLVKTREILAHGTEEPFEWLAQFEYVQHLAPWHLEQALTALGEGKDSHKESQKDTQRREGRGNGRKKLAEPTARAQKAQKRGACGNAAAAGGNPIPASVCLGEGKTGEVRSQRSEVGNTSTPSAVLCPPSSVLRPHWVAIPNFVDTGVFHPLPESPNERINESSKLRKQFGIPEDAFVIGTSAAVKKPHKRIDYLIRVHRRFLLSCARHYLLIVADVLADHSVG
jgi:hypothetical protein